MDFSNMPQEEINVSELTKFTFLTEKLGQEGLKELLDYNPETGDFYWKISVSTRVRVGEKAGTVHHSGYIWIRISGFHYTAHELAWFYMYGEYTKVDHKDRCNFNNAILNLRKATRSQNNANRILPSKSGIRGVRQTRTGKYEARIQVEYRYIHLGTFDTIKEASEKYQEAAKELFGEFFCDQ